jgi:hypothetical protein
MSAAALAAVLVATVLPLATNATAPRADCAGDKTKPDLAEGAGTIAVANHELVVIGKRRDGCLHQRTVMKKGLLRHVAAAPDLGTAFVEDATGEDTVVVITEDGIERVSGGGEVTQPSWSSDGRLAWAVDMDRLAVLGRSGASVRTIPAPRAALGVFSPVFSDDSLVAVTSEDVPGFVAYEDDQLNNLWAYDEASGRWKQLTNFSATADRWSIIRTPVTLDDGSVLFVRATGRASQTGMPSFELWKLTGERAAKVRDLPREMYLAGTREGSLLWNVFSDRCGDWELLVERPGGLQQLGCGAVLVDPVNVTDGDLEVEEHAAEPAPGGEPEDPATATAGVVIGDFATKAAAARVLVKVADGSVITHKDAPQAVRPGAFAVTVAIPAGSTAEETLAAVRKAVPRLAAKSYLAPLDR